MEQGIFNAIVLNLRKVTDGIFEMTLGAYDEPLPLYLPGHFIMLEPMVPGSIMWRPFSVYNYENGNIVILFQVRAGESNTKAYSQLSERYVIRVTGPKGRAFCFDSEVSNYLHVAGGIGVGGIGFITKAALQLGKRTHVFLGAKSKDLLVGQSYLSELGAKVDVITEEGVSGGFVTDLLDEELSNYDHDKKVIVIACGPPLMLEAVHLISSKYNCDCYFMPEEIMACRGTYSCKGCSIPLLDGKPFHVCHDGFVDSSMVDMEAYTRRYKPSPRISAVVSDKIDQAEKDPFKTVLAGPNGLSVEFPYPWGNAAGCLDVYALLKGNYEPDDFGFFLAKGERIDPKIGNPPHRVKEVPGGMLNSIGLEGDGIDAFKNSKLPQWNAFDQETIVNIWGGSPREYAEVAFRLWQAGVKIIEVNLSCPNLNKRIPGKYSGDTYEIIKAIRKRCPDMFIIAKLTAMTTDIYQIGQSAYEAGANAITAINTLEGMDIDIHSRRPVLGGVYAGLSGPAIYTVGLKSVHLLSKLPIPIIGCGGIYDAEHAIKYFLAGAKMIQVGTELFRNPYIMKEIKVGVLEYLEEQKVHSVSEIVGQVVF